VDVRRNVESGSGERVGQEQVMMQRKARELMAGRTCRYLGGLVWMLGDEGMVCAHFWAGRVRHFLPRLRCPHDCWRATDWTRGQLVK
jgi:hypothetical protein